MNYEHQSFWTPRQADENEDRRPRAFIVNFFYTKNTKHSKYTSYPKHTKYVRERNESLQNTIDRVNLIGMTH